MKYEGIIKDSSVNLMVNRIIVRKGGSMRTVETYAEGIKHFVDYLGVSTPSEALEKARSGSVEKLVDGFIDFSMEKYAPNTVLRLICGIKKWLRMNDVEVKWNTIEMPSSAIRVIQDRAPSRDELVKLTKYCSIRDQAMIYVLASSGLRIGTLLTLTIGDVNFDYDDVAKVTVMKKAGRKFSSKNIQGTKNFYCTFVTPEAKKALLEYMELRERRGEKLRPDSPLFVHEKRKKLEAISHESFRRQWARILEKTDLTEKTHTWFMLHVHVLRKFFRTQCANGGVKDTYFNYWLGHKNMGYLDESYFRAQESEHLAEYRKAIPYLTIQEPKEIHDLKRQLEDERRKREEEFTRLDELNEQLMKLLETGDILVGGKSLKEAIKRSEQNGDNSYTRLVIEEDQLPDYPDWEIEQVLSSGKVSIRKQTPNSV